MAGFLHRDARLPEERRRLRQGRGVASWPTAWCPADRAEDADVVVVNTCAFIEAARQESIDTILALADARKPGPSSWSRGAWPSATATSSPRRCPRSTRWSGSPARAATVVRERGVGSAERPTGSGPNADGRARPARAAPARAERAVGVREGRRGLRPRLRVLRHPVVPRQAALADARVDRGRGARAGRAAVSPRSCSSRRTSPGTGATSASRARSRRCCVGSTRSPPHGLARIRLLYLYPSEVRDPLVATMLELPTVVPYFDLSLQHADRAPAARA